MDRSRADKILADWDRLSSRARRPGLTPRRAMTTGLPASTITGAALLVVAVAASLWFGLPPGVGQPGAQGSVQPVAASASPTVMWGPLAVIPPQGGADQARTEGTLRITDACVFLERGGEVTLLFWPADRATWSAASRAITFENFDGSVVTVGDGDHVVLGGGGDTEAESGISGEEWVRRMEWVAPPASSCSLDPRWGVGAVGSSR